MASPSPNFAFLEPRDPLLHKYASLAERYFAEDPNGAVVKLRQFAEALTHAAAAGLGLVTSTDEDFFAMRGAVRPRPPPWGRARLSPPSATLRVGPAAVRILAGLQRATGPP